MPNATTSLYENKSIIRDNLMNQLKTYRNFSIKICLASWITAFSAHFAMNTINVDPVSLNIEDALFNSLKFSAVFIVIGYCIGSVVGAHFQRSRLSKISEEREKIEDEVRKIRELNKQLAN